jgi:hypothetical protein
MAAFNDFLDLQTAVVEAVGRPDIVDVMPRLVQLAETVMNRKLRCADQITSATLTFAAGVATMPADVAEIIGLYRADGLEYIAQPLQSVRQSGTQGYYAVSGNTILTYGLDGDLTLQYYAQLPTISGGVTETNWLLTKYPHAYLYAVSLEAAKHIREVEMAQTFRILLDDEMQSIAGDDYAQRYARAMVRVAGNTP